MRRRPGKSERSMRQDDGLDRWVTFWAEKRRSRDRAYRQARRSAAESRDDYASVLYDIAIILAAMLGAALLLHVLVVGLGS
jgi:hypothetical protein